VALREWVAKKPGTCKNDAAACAADDKRAGAEEHKWKLVVGSGKWKVERGARWPGIRTVSQGIPMGIRSPTRYAC